METFKLYTQMNTYTILIMVFSLWMITNIAVLIYLIKDIRSMDRYTKELGRIHTILGK